MEVQNEEVAKKLWEFSEKQIEQLEKQGAVKRALAKKEAEQKKDISEPAAQAQWHIFCWEERTYSRVSEKSKGEINF